MGSERAGHGRERKIMSKRNQTFKRPMVGVDLGATKIFTVAVDTDGEILATSKKSAKGEKGPETVIRRVADTVNDALKQAGLKNKDIGAVGMAVPSPVDQNTGVALFSPNLNWRDLPVRDMLEKLIPLSVFPENDVNLGTLGEFSFGAGRGVRDMAGFFVGTGIGGGVILNGRLVHGKNWTGGELGHMVILADGPQCGCGTRGCLEALASRIAITRDIRDAMARGVPTCLKDLMDQDTDRVKSGVFKRAYRMGDELVISVLTRASWHIGIAVANIVNAVGPELVVIGGGLFEALGKELMPTVQQSANMHFFGPAGQDMPVVLAELGDDSVPLGAAAFAAQKIQDK